MVHVGLAAAAAAAGTAAAVAIGAALAERRRTRRSDPDAVGIMPWTTVQAVAFMVALVLGILAWKAG